MFRVYVKIKIAGQWMFIPLKMVIDPYKVVPPSYKLVYKPHEYYRYITNKNHSEIGVMFTNLKLSNGGTTLYGLYGCVWK